MLSHVYAYTSCHSYRELNFGPRVDRDDKRGLLFMGERNLYALVNYKRGKHTWALGLGVRRTDRETER